MSPRPAPKAPKPWIPLHARGEWDRLAAALAETVTPCQGEADAWFGDDVSTRQEAVAACARCSLLTECRNYARAANERHGVWAGIDRTPRPNPRSNDTDRSEQ